MIVAVIVVRMMQAPVDEVVGVVAMRNRVVSAIGSVDMTGFVTISRLGMTVRVANADSHDVLIDMVLVRVMQMPVVQVVGVPVMQHRGVPATGAMNVAMRFMDLVIVMAHPRTVSPSRTPDQSDAPERHSHTPPAQAAAGAPG